MAKLLCILALLWCNGLNANADDALHPIAASAASAPVQPTSQPPVSTTTDPADPHQLKSIADTASPKLPEPAVKVVPLPPSFDKTLMFNDELLKTYEDAYGAYQEKMKNRGGVADKLGDLANSLRGNDDKLAPAPAGIYLNSILYRTGLDGVAWIDGVKYKVNGIYNNVKLIALTQNAATIEWRTAGYDVDFKTWQNLPSTSEKDPDLSKLPPDQQNIRIDNSTKSIIFTLRPNQRLDVGLKAIREGVPVAVAKAPEVKAPDSKAAPGALSDLDKLVNKAKEAIQDETPAPKIMEKITPPVDNNIATFKLSPNGHFDIPAKLNDRNLTFKADTGATITAISSEDAVKIGIDVTKLDYNVSAKLADGKVIQAAKTNIENFVIEPISLQNVEILVTQGTMAQPLMGMNLLTKLNATIKDDGTMTLHQ